MRFRNHLAAKSIRASIFQPNQVTISSMSLAGCTSACVICGCDVDGTVKGGETGAGASGVTGRGEKVRVLGYMGYLGQSCQFFDLESHHAVSKDLEMGLPSPSKILFRMIILVRNHCTLVRPV